MVMSAIATGGASYYAPTEMWIKMKARMYKMKA